MLVKDFHPSVIAHYTLGTHLNQEVIISHDKCDINVACILLSLQNIPKWQAHWDWGPVGAKQI